MPKESKGQKRHAATGFVLTCWGTLAYWVASNLLSWLGAFWVSRANGRVRV